ncbi:M23 family metallopeptidase [Motiliproteus sp. MSK22-1]|uniref:M23 family metallopeptidase n=1 Tax=Motiliproteus sp. MSK22-1 TaxID=1897630 RepID=UPI000978B44F|nr:M23 family metallopeptidase [Motiliproteus sp. MSK22-1]OMH33960.1 peptidase M23 [Motiliproteus sp. MSK22-1]
MKYLLAALPLLLASFNLTALELPLNSPVPGGIIHLPLQGKESPKVIYRKHRVMVVPATATRYADQADWVALVGIPLSAKAGTETVNINGNNLSFKIESKQYKEQRLVIKNKRKVNPTPLDMTRINKEKKEILTALASWSEPKTHAPVTTLLKPAQGPHSSPFGLRRFFNDQPRKPHSGLDIAAPKNSPIIAPAPAKVVATGDYFFNGRTVILDHGNGLTSLYCHMNRIDVKLGETLKTGDQLGTIGATGRVTGPHLHWGVSLNNARIDPTLLMVESK